MRKLALTALSVLITIQLIAQPGRLFDQQLKIKQMNVRITSDCFTATTFIEMEFYNNKPQEVEGAWFFRLQPGQVITALQLDLHGKYRDGSIEERNQAANAYNTIVGKRIDPALLQYISSDQYKLSVYPVPANSSRKVTITIQQLLNEENGKLLYYLPVGGADSVSNLDVSIRMSDCFSRPVTTAGYLANDAFSASANGFNLSKKQEKVKLPITLGFYIPTRGETLLRIKESNGQKFFALRFTPQDPKPTPVSALHLRVYWDVSFSGANRDRNKEIDFLEKYMAKHQLQTITIIPFSVQTGDAVSFSAAAGNQWKRYLQGLQFEGGTRYDNLSFQTHSSEVILVFSDGKKTLGNKPPGENWAPVFSISSSYDPDSSFLKHLPGKSGGRYIDLYRIPVNEAVEMSSVLQSDILNITSLSNETNMHIRRTGPQSPVLVYGTFKGQEEILVRYGNVNYVTSDGYPLHGAGGEGSAIDRIPMLLAYPQVMRSNDWNGQLDFGIEEKVVTPRTSFIVLERVEDYVNFNITPPKELEEECRAQGFVKKSARELRDQERQNIENRNMLNLVSTYNRLLKDDVVKGTVPVRSRGDFELFQQGIIPSESVIETKANLQSVPVAQEDMEEVVVTIAYGVRRPQKDLGYSVATVKGEELNKAQAVNVQSGLTGKVSGLNVTTVNNGVFENTRMTLRGIRSLTGNNQPLLVLDGSVVPLRYLNQINPNDIQEITVLKGATASALYGSEGVNGVIVVSSKKYRETNYNRKYRLKDMPEEEYIQQLESTPYSLKISEYASLKKIHGHKALFYVEVAQHFHNSGLRTKAKEILFNAAEVTNSDPVTMRSIAFVLEAWGEYEDAITIYSELKDRNHEVVRDLAWCYYQAGYKQKAVDLLYGTMRSLSIDYTQKALLLDDMNAMIAVNKDISTVHITKELLVSNTADLRLVLSSNTGSFHSMEVQTATEATRAITMGNSNIYQVGTAARGKHRVTVRHTDATGATVPMMIKMMVFKNFGKPNQSIEVQNVIMNNQTGIVEIADVKW